MKKFLENIKKITLTVALIASNIQLFYNICSDVAIKGNIYMLSLIIDLCCIAYYADVKIKELSEKDNKEKNLHNTCNF